MAITTKGEHPPESVHIHVNDHHIFMGENYSCTACPIAMAARDAGIDVSSVTQLGIRSWSGLRYWLPESAREFMERFDSGKDVGPFRFRAVLCKPAPSPEY